MKGDKVGTYSFVAEPFHVDFTGRLFMGVLGNHLLNCAGFHAEERGFGMAEINESNYTWVLSRLAVELEEMPRQYEEFSFERIEAKSIARSARNGASGRVSTN